MTPGWVRVTPRQHKPPALIRGHLISQLFQILSKAEGWFICLCQCVSVGAMIGIITELRKLGPVTAHRYRAGRGHDVITK